MPKLPKKKIVNEHLQTPEGQALFEEFARQQKERVERGTENNKGAGEGVLPSVETSTFGNEKGKENNQSSTQEGPKAEEGLKPELMAKAFSSFVTMFGNFYLFRQGREFISDMEMETYAKEITPFVTKYKDNLKYIVEIQALGASGMFVWAIAQKPVVDQEKFRAYQMRNKKGEVRNGES